MSSEDKKPEESLAERGLKAVTQAASSASTKAVERGVESFVPAPFRDSARGLIDKLTKPEDPKKDEPKPEVAAQGAPAAATIDKPLAALKEAFETGKKVGAELLKDGEKAINEITAPLVPALTLPTDGVTNKITSALTRASGSVTSLVNDANAGSKDRVPLTPAVQAAIDDVTTALGTERVTTAPAAESGKSAFNPRFSKPDAKGEVVITKTSDGGHNVQTSTESVYERALRAMQANDKAAGKEPQKYEALNAAADVAAQSTPVAKSAGGKGHTK
jgi:hypothetical protein